MEIDAANRHRCRRRRRAAVACHRANNSPLELDEGLALADVALNGHDRPVALALVADVGAAGVLAEAADEEDVARLHFAFSLFSFLLFSKLRVRKAAEMEAGLRGELRVLWRRTASGGRKRRRRRERARPADAAMRVSRSRRHKR